MEDDDVDDDDEGDHNYANNDKKARIVTNCLRTQDKTRAFSVQKTLSSTTAVVCVVQSSVFTSFCTVEALNNASHLALWAEVSGSQLDCVRLFRRCNR